MGDCPIIRGIRQVFLIIGTGESDPLGNIPHFLGILFDLSSANVKELGPSIGLHLAAGLPLDREFDIDTVTVDAPWEIDLLADQPLATGDDIDHRILGHRTDMPGP